MRHLYSLFLILLLFSCSRNNLLTWKTRRFYSEESIICKDSVKTLVQSVNYNEPHTIDEEHSYSLTLVFHNVEAAKAKRIIDLERDTAIVSASYGLFSVWTWDAPDNKVSGKIEVKKWDMNTITLKENVHVYDKYSNKHFDYIGTRTFTPREGW